MSPAQSALWSKIEQFPIDDPASDFSFSDRLARENGWSKSKTAAVIKEYLKFVFLACEAGHPVTPSLDVDEAWHLHMIYTRSYWTDLCQNTIERPLHHGPTKGGSSESSKFHEWYLNTLDSYSRLFDQPPPTEIWPAAKQRFSNQNNPVRINKATHWVIPKPHKRFSSDRILFPLNKIQMASTRTIVSVLLASVLALFMIGCNQEMEISNPLNSLAIWHFNVLYPILWVVILLITNHLQKTLLDSPLCEDAWKYKEESPEMIALMVQHSCGGGETNVRLALLILSRLLSENKIQFIHKIKGHNPYVFPETFITPLNPFDAEVCKIIANAPVLKLLSRRSIWNVLFIEFISDQLAETQIVKSLEKEITSSHLYDIPKRMPMLQLIGFMCHMAYIAFGITIWRYFDIDKSDNGRTMDPDFGLEIIFGGFLGFIWYLPALFMKRYSKGSKILVYLTNEIKPAVISQPDANDIDYWRNLALYGLSVLPTSDSFHEFKAYSSNELDPPSSCGG
ncbi:MAG: hypothetical protein DWI24_00480 [Planctomycetota bacterium]|nr:MAG: hypothetical protein DWI24_00480 [Planctomycetota bacterium]